MIVIHRDDNEVVVSINKSVRIGSRYHISPSMGMEGIEDGVVEVEEIRHYDELVQEDANVSSLVELDDSLTQSLWVLYRYTYCPDMDEDDLEYIIPLPLGIFIEHVSQL